MGDRFANRLASRGGGCGSVVEDSDEVQSSEGRLWTRSIKEITR